MRILLFIVYSLWTIPQFTHTEPLHLVWMMSTDQENISVPQPGKKYYGDSKGPRIELFIPQPIGIEEMSLYEYIMVLSEEQTLAIGALYQQYLIDEGTLRSNHLIPLWEQSSAAAAGPFYRVPGGDRLCRKLRTDRQRVLGLLSNHDDELFNRIQSVLDESQLLLLDRVRKQRVRIRAKSSTSYEIPGSDVDMVFLLSMLQWQNNLDPSLIGNGLREFVNLYEESATSLFRDYAYEDQNASYRCSMMDCVYLQGEANADLDEDPEVREAKSIKHSEQRRTTLRLPVPIAIRLAELNRKFMYLFASELDEPFRSQFLQIARHEICAAIYDDPFELSSLLWELSTLELLSNDQIDSLANITNTYHTKRKSIENIMMDKFVAYKKVWKETYSKGPDAKMAIFEQINGLDQQRLKNAQDTLKQIRELLTEEQRRAVEGSLKEAETQMKQPIVPFNKRVYL